MKPLRFFLFFLTTLSVYGGECDPSHPPALELFYSPYCYYSLKVLNYLKSIDKTVPLKNVADDPTAKEELRVKGGKMQVPCLLIEDIPLYESDEIIYWLSENQECLEKAQTSHEDLPE